MNSTCGEPYKSNDLQVVPLSHELQYFYSCRNTEVHVIEFLLFMYAATCNKLQQHHLDCEC